MMGMEWTPERRARHSVIMKAREKDPEFQKKIAASRQANLAKGQAFSDDRRARHSAKLASVVNTPEWRAKQTRGLLRKLQERERKKTRNAAPAWCPPILAEHYVKMRRTLGAVAAKREIITLMEKDPKMWPFKKRDKSDPLALVQRVQALKVERGDIVIVTVPLSADPKQMLDCRNIFLQAFGDTVATVLVVHAGTEVELVKPSYEPPAAL